MPSKIPKTASRTTLVPSIQSFLTSHPDLHLGGTDPYPQERAHHLRVFGIHAISKDKIHPIGSVEFTAIRGPHGTIPIRILYPSSGETRKKEGKAGALVYFHGGGYTVGSVDEFENGLRLLAEEAGVQVYAVEYRLAPEHQFPVQLDEYSAVISALQSDFGSSRGVDPARVLGGGDSAGGNMTAAVTLRRRDEGLKNLRGQILCYPEARLPFDTPAATENNSGYYLECNGIFSFADHYLPRGTPPGYKYISPGMQTVEYLQGQPPAAVYTSGFDPLRDVGVEYASKLDEAGVKVQWRHYEGMTHGWLQMTAWSDEAISAVKDVAQDAHRFAYED
ncbi:lipase/esterase [Macrophomina phaseolina]|uniref:Lipase/esterase n=1 Tax=Macrophomina phaseolina TaxID=35725 RepID=A0ABQ8FU04_9PEZI|nr:lipase/esterase [Macrophomina phaseolina]